MKFIEPLGQKGPKKRYYQYTAIDDCTRLRVLRAYPRNDQTTAIAFIDHVLSKLPFAIDQVQTDNGQEFGSRSTGTCSTRASATSASGPEHRASTANWRDSRSIDSEEFYRLLEGEVIDDARLFETRLQEWEDYYNYHRPHGALDGQTPYERLRLKAQDPLS